MSWLFSQALVAEFSAATCWGGAPSAPLNVMPTPHKFWRNDKTMDHSLLSQFGLTCAVLTEDHGATLLTWYQEVSLVKTSPSLVAASALQAPGPLSGHKWQELSVRYDLGSSRWRTHQCLWDEDLHWSSVSLPKWGMTLAGVCWEQLTSAPLTNAIEFGLSPSTAKSKRLRRMWPTPVASMAKGSSVNALTRKSGANRSNDRLDHAVMALDGGHLNPEWVEWLMGWPIGWTDLKPLEMAKFQQWQQLHFMTFPSEAAA